MKSPKKPTKAQLKSEREFCDKIATDVLSMRGIRLQPAKDGISGYSSGEFEIETKAGTLWLQPIGHTVFARFLEPERAMVWRSYINKSGKWNHHFEAGTGLEQAKDFDLQLSAAMAGPKIPIDLVARRERANRHKAWNQASMSDNADLTKAEELLLEALRSGVVTRTGHRFHMGRTDIWEPPNNTVSLEYFNRHAAHAVLNNPELHAALKKAVRSSGAGTKHKPATVPSQARKLRENGPALPHKGGCPSCGRFHSLEEHNKHTS